MKDLTSIQEAKASLPLPQLMEKLGLSEHAKSKAKCPFHDPDRHPSFGIFNTGGRWGWKCHAGCGEGDEIDLVAKVTGKANSEAIQHYLEIAGRERPTQAPKPAFKWRKYKELARSNAGHLAAWRGYSREFCEWLADENIVGIHKNQWAIAIRNDNGQIVGAHLFSQFGRPSYDTNGDTKVRPLIFGDVTNAKTFYVFESQWDAFALWDKWNERNTGTCAAICTRGAENGKLITSRIPAGAKIVAFPQNDKPEDYPGKPLVPSEKWLRDVISHAGCAVEVVRIPAEHKDLNDWVKAGATGEDIVGAVKAASVVTPETPTDSAAASPFPEIDDVADLIQSPPEMAPAIIEGVLHQGWKMVLGGSSKSFKTWSQMDMAISVATGTDWWGFPTKQGRVLYCNFENQRAGAARRFAAIAEARGVVIPKGMLRVWNLRGHCGNVTAIVQAIIEEATRVKYTLIDLDPIYKLMNGRDENAAGEVAMALQPLDRMAEETGAAIVYGHHYSKGNQSAKEAIDRMSGSGVFARDADAILTLTRHEEDDAFTVDSILRECPPVDPFVVRWQFPLMTRDGSLDPAKLKQAKTGREAKYSPDDILRVLAEMGDAGTSEWQQRCKEEMGIGESRFYDFKRQVSQRIYRHPVSNKWSLYPDELRKLQS